MYIRNQIKKKHQYHNLTFHSLKCPNNATITTFYRQVAKVFLQHSLYRQYNAYFVNALSTLLKNLPLVDRLTFQLLNLIAIFAQSFQRSHRNLNFIKQLSLRYSILSYTRHPIWRTTPCRISATANSIYKHTLLPLLPAGCALYLQYQDAQFSRKYGSDDNGDANG